MLDFDMVLIIMNIYLLSIVEPQRTKSCQHFPRTTTFLLKSFIGLIPIFVFFSNCCLIFRHVRCAKNEENAWSSSPSKDFHRFLFYVSFDILYHPAYLGALLHQRIYLYLHMLFSNKQVVIENAIANKIGDHYGNAEIRKFKHYSQSITQFTLYYKHEESPSKVLVCKSLIRLQI